jgi:hypothetical protein
MATAAVTFDSSSLDPVYDGQSKAATVTTIPAGLDVSFTYAKDGKLVASPISAGSYTVTATIVDPNYQGSASGTLTIAKATPIVAWAEPADINYGTALSTRELDATASVPGVFTYGLTAGAILDAGQGQVLVATFTPTDTADYSIVPVSTTLNVLKATPVITWANPTDIVYGTALSGTQLNAAVAGTGPAATGAVTYSPAAATVLNAGSRQSLTVTMAGTNDYNPVTATVYLNVTQAPLTITVDDSHKTYGDPNPNFTVGYRGFVNGDDASKLSGSLTYSTAATTRSNVGSYAVSATGQTSSNYAIGYVSGTLAVNPQTNVQDFYTGLYLATTASATSGRATLTLSATVKDLSPASNVGNITTSNVTFILTNSVDGSAPNIVSGLLSNLPVSLVSPGDPKTGTAATTVTIDIGTADNQQFKIAILVGGNYSDANRSVDDLLTIAKPQPGSITGGGYLIVERTAGLIPGDAGSKSNFEVDPKYWTTRPGGIC